MKNKMAILIRNGYERKIRDDGVYDAFEIWENEDRLVGIENNNILDTITGFELTNITEDELMKRVTFFKNKRKNTDITKQILEKVWTKK